MHLKQGYNTIYICGLISREGKPSSKQFLVLFKLRFHLDKALQQGLFLGTRVGENSWQYPDNQAWYDVIELRG